MRFPIVCASLLLQVTGSYAQLQEHFDSISNWKGTDTAFRIKAGRLQSHYQQPGSNFYVSTPSSLSVNCSWEWWMRLDFNTSSLNYVDVYLNADSSELTSGYFVRIGNTKDEVCLYRKGRAGNPVIIIDGRDGITDHTSTELKIKVTCDEHHEWTLWVNGVAEGTVTDSLLTTSGYMGFAIRQSTASFFEKHFFDDVLVMPLIQDTVPPLALSLEVVSDTSLKICFSEPLDSLHGNFQITDLNAQVTSIVQGSCVNIYSDIPFPNGDSCHLLIKDIRDVAGNIRPPFNMSFLYYKEVPEHAVVINEILYDPESGIPEFIELYNYGRQAADVSLLKLTKRKPSGELYDSAVLSKYPLLLLPDTYAAFTTNPEALCKRYTCQAPTYIYNMNLPTLTNKEGTVVLLGAGGTILDELHYSDDMHFVLADHTKGVSLERLDPRRPTQDPDNWHSAAGTAGYATPGMVNSQLLQVPALPGNLTISPGVFSPDNDGTDDVTVIRYELPEAGYIANITIFDAMGRPIRYLQRNILLATKGQMIWDGLGESNRILTTGIYIVFIEMFNQKGTVKRWKLPLVLAKHMN
jgi:hypothetical protein